MCCSYVNANMMMNGQSYVGIVDVVHCFDT
jgi:hypothetical protein